jgi:hypothetical protein
MEAYKKDLFETGIYLKLKEAELEAASTKKRYTHEEVVARLKKIISQSETFPYFTLPIPAPPGVY